MLAGSRPRRCFAWATAPVARASARTGASQVRRANIDRKSTRLNSSHDQISYAVFCLKKKKIIREVIFVVNIVSIALAGVVIDRPQCFARDVVCASGERFRHLEYLLSRRYCSHGKME